MKKKLLLIVAILCITLSNLKAQDVFNKGTIAVNATVGLSNYNTRATYYGNYGLGIPPVALTVDVGAFDGLIADRASIGIGGYAGMASYSYKYYDYYKETLTRMCFGVRGTFHFQLTDKLDTYAGVMLGLYTYSYKYNYNTVYADYYNYKNRSSSSTMFSTFIGARYYMSDSFGFCAEMGYGFTYLSAGLTFKF